MGPERHLAVADRAGEGEAGAHQRIADAAAPGRRLDVEQPQPREPVALVGEDDRAGHGARQLGDPASVAALLVVAQETRDGVGDVVLQPAAPAIFLAVEDRLARGQEAEVACAEHANGEPSLRGRVEKRASPAQRRREVGLLRRRQRAQHPGDLLPLALVELGEHRPAGVGQRDRAAARVRVGGVADDPAARLEPRQHAAEEAGVHAQRPLQIDGQRPAAVRDLEQHPRLWQRELATQEARVQRPDAARVEPIEAANRGDGVFHPAALEYLVDPVKHLLDCAATPADLRCSNVTTSRIACRLSQPLRAGN